MSIILYLLAVVLALKIAEATGGLEIDSWGGAFGAALVCWLGGWGTGALIALILPDPETLRTTIQSLWLVLAVQVIATMVLLLAAWALVPGVHIRRFSGLLIASILIVAFTYAASALIPALGLGL